MNPILIALEILVFFEIILFIVVNLRTAVLHRSGISRDLKQVFYAYRENGFWMDLIGVLPLNLVLAYVGSYAWYVNAIICVLRLSRMVQVWRLPRLLGRF